MVFAGLVLVRKKRAAQRWLHSEDIEVVRRDARASDQDRLVPTGQRCTPTSFGGHVLEDGVLVRPIEIVQGGDAIEPAVRKPFEDAHDAVRVGIWQRTQQHAIHKTEHGRIRADRERDGGNRDSREARAVAKQPNCVAKVVKYAGRAVHGTPVASIDFANPKSIILRMPFLRMDSIRSYSCPLSPKVRPTPEHRERLDPAQPE